MDERDTRYIENLRRVRALVRPETHAGMKAADLLEEIKQNAAESYTLMQQSNAILDEVIFSRRAENLTEEEAAGLSEFAGKLFHYANSEDSGIAYKIHALLLDYARLAVTEENVALLARQALAARPQVNAALLADEYPNDFARIIGLHTYSQSPHRDYDIQLTGNWVERGGFRFEDFVLTRRREEENGNH